VQRVSSSPQAPRRHRQDRVSNAPWALRVHGHAVRRDQRAIDVPGAHEHCVAGLPAPLRPRLFRRHPNLQPDMVPPSAVRPHCLPGASGVRPLPQAEQVLLWRLDDLLPRHIVSGNDVAMDLAKVEAMRSWPTPTRCGHCGDSLAWSGSSATDAAPQARGLSLDTGCRCRIHRPQGCSDIRADTAGPGLRQIRSSSTATLLGAASA
jgi:hypothetical protein